ncbi:hypothetical protein PIB30_006216, partial [Stylosanthes scabra]|nr:hypothetical protein [Stylosanthes scabra]
ASAQRNSDNSTPDTLRNPLDEENPLMRDILSDISDHEDDFLHDEEDGVDVNLDQPFEVGEGQMVAVSPQSYHVPPSSQFSDINWDAMDGSNEFPEFQGSEEWRPMSELRVGLKWRLCNPRFP